MLLLVSFYSCFFLSLYQSVEVNIFSVFNDGTGSLEVFSVTVADEYYVFIVFDKHVSTIVPTTLFPIHGYIV